MMEHGIKITLKYLLLSLGMIVVGLCITTISAHADIAKLGTNSWDPGLKSQQSNYNQKVHAWGSRSTQGMWGTSGVNYQAGATTVYTGNKSGYVSYRMNATYGANDLAVNSGTYGSGSGYKGFIQLWNDSQNVIAIGFIHDPGVSPTGYTIMVEGMANGKPVGGYWPSNAIHGNGHTFEVWWNGNTVTVQIDGLASTRLSYPVKSNHPSISFLGAARNTGDVVDVTFDGITFGSGSIKAEKIKAPAGKPYATYDATLNVSGSGKGYSGYVNIHDSSANPSAIAFGIQADKGNALSKGKPMYTFEVVNHGKTYYQYFNTAPKGKNIKVSLKWWKSKNTAIAYVNNKPIGITTINLNPRLFFNAEANGKSNGDKVNTKVKNIKIGVGNNSATYGLNGTWNTAGAGFNMHGLQAKVTSAGSAKTSGNYNTHGQLSYNKSIAITGTVSGLPSGHDWDTDLVAGIGMIAQYWNGK
ncbi:MAG: hypothetical protein LBN22_08055 [Clostridiales Family XIII bacterium]|jgi:hypothetical protein|nr:hypothetical protein [Clostridiales Family XIII bacterium]